MIDYDATKELLRARVVRTPAILTLAELLGLRLADVARLLGVHFSAVRQWAFGDRPMPAPRQRDLLIDLARVLNLLILRGPQDPAEAARWELLVVTADMWLHAAAREFGAENMRTYRLPERLRVLGYEDAAPLRAVCEKVLAEHDQAPA